jgi:hypothetical protein
MGVLGGTWCACVRDATFFSGFKVEVAGTHSERTKTAFSFYDWNLD